MSEMFGIRKDGDGWRCFGDEGYYPGLFEREAARWGTWAKPDDVYRINIQENRLITMDDIRAFITRDLPPEPREGVD